MPAASKISDWFSQAKARWPRINWPRESFSKHVGKDDPPHPLDLFLAGAAGNRIDAAWESIESDFGPKTRSVLQRQPIADYTPDDLWSETITRLISPDPNSPALPDGRPPAQIIRYRGLVQLLNYLIVIARRLGIQRKRQMRPVTSLSSTDDDLPQQDIPTDEATPAENAESRDDAQDLRWSIATAYSALSPEQRFLIAMVYRQGMKQKDAGAMLGWSEFKTCRVLAAAMQFLRLAIVRWAGSEWSGELAAAWEQSLQNCWNQVQLPRVKASNPPAKANLAAKG